MSIVASIERELRRAVGAMVVRPNAEYLADETEARGFRGRADAVALPGTAEEAAEVVAWCYAHGVPVVPRGGGTGYAAGAVPLDGGVVLALERLGRVRSFDPLLWRIEVEAGMRTADLRRIVRENGLYFPPDPGAAEQSQIGGNVATNAGGPHAFKYGVTGAWVTGLEAVLAPGELVRIGGAIRKDVAGYDLKNLLIGSEGTLGIVTSVWLRLIPPPETSLPVVGFYGDIASGTAAIAAVLGNGIAAAALEYLDAGALDASRGSFPAPASEAARFMVIAEADERTLEIGARHGLATCSWGHAGDGNLHSTFMVDAHDDAELARAHAAAEELFALAVELGGSISGEHGTGWVKRGQLARQWSPRLLELHAAVKDAFDPKGLMNPGKKQ